MFGSADLGAGMGSVNAILGWGAS